ncbi:MAG TPA: protein kinase [Thermoanaerobaculia bacterium]|nr:protein kinase [Thermoanaerobaculia bacterium]
MSLSAGTVLGRYEILGQLGAGGMGEVYRARDPSLGREVALKVVSGAGHADPDLVERFEREARAVAALAHPNIVTVFDVGSAGGAPYLVCELLDGTTLRRRLQRGPLPVAEAVAWASQLLRGVGAAHALRIVHRDVKPENLFLTAAGLLKILDFGLAKLAGGSVAEGMQDAPALTQTGQVVGTVGYMAPEQLRGEPVDARADLFSVGAVLYEMISGKAPFRRATAPATMAAVLAEEPPALAEELRLPAGLDRLIRRCLEKSPENRFQTAADLLFALETPGVEQPPSSAATPPAPAHAAARAARSIAVLPFADMSPGRDQEYLCEGLAEELINALTQIRGLRVAARSSSFLFRGSGVDLRAVGERLGVDTVLEGSVRKAGDRLRVSVQLIDVADGYHRWSQRYDRKLEDVFAIEDEIAESVATALRGVLSDGERERLLRRPSTDPQAYEYYLRGRRQVNQITHASFETALAMFRRALELDPRYAPAWAGVAEVHSWLYQWWGGSAEDLAAAEEASRRALALAPHLADAQAARGWAVSLARRYQEAAGHFEEAVRLNPGLWEGYYYWARTCFAAGDVERSAELFRRAADSRLEDFQSLTLLAQSLRMLGRDEEALAAAAEAVRRLERRLELEPADPRALSLGAHSLHEVGQTQRAVAWVERALELYPEEQTVVLNALCLYSRMGHTERAFELLEEVARHGWGKRDWIDHDPDYDSLRDDPRFQAFLERLP